MCILKETKDFMDTNNSDHHTQKLSLGIAHQRPERSRMKKRISILLHTHVALIILTLCASLDGACVIGQIIADILIMKDELHEKEIIEATSKEIIFQTFNDILNMTTHWSLPSMLMAVKQELGRAPNDGLDHDPLEQLARHAQTPWQLENDTSLELNHFLDDFHNHHHDHGVFHSHLRHKRDVGGAHKHDMFTDSAIDRHYMLHELTHAFHLGSMVILTFLVLVTYFKILIMGKKFLHLKIEVFDAFVISVSWALDLVFWEGLWAQPEDEAANIMIFILPWRVIRIVNGCVLVIQGRDLLQLKIVKQQYRGSVKKANEFKLKVELSRVEVKNLHSLCKRKGASEKEIQMCAANPGARRRRSSLMPVLNRLASLGFSVNSQTDLTKATYDHELPTPNDSDDDLDATYLPAITKMSSASLEDFTFGRKVSNSISSALVLSQNECTNSFRGEDNLVVATDFVCQSPNGVAEMTGCR